jgi:hypothetical protein
MRTALASHGFPLFAALLLTGVVALVVAGVAVFGERRATTGTTSEASRAGATPQRAFDWTTPDDPGPGPLRPVPTVQGLRALGSPAIRPRTAPESPTTPTFTVQDVEEYVRVRGLSASLRIRWEGPITVEKVEFLPGREVAARLNDYINQPDDVLLCLAMLRGRFGVASPFAPLAFDSSSAYVVFDAHTGNTLMFGLRE